MAGQSISKGALVLTTDAAALQSGLSKVQGQIESFSNRVTSLLGAQLGLQALSGFADKIKEIGDESENFLNLAEVFEINVEKMQGLAHAANLAGIETESLVKAMRIASEKFPDEANPVQSLFKALEELRKIPNIQERIKAASELFGGKNAVEVLKLMKADLPAMSAELEKSAALSERQLKAWDALGDAISLALTKLKNFGKGVAADLFSGGNRTLEGIAKAARDPLMDALDKLDNQFAKGQPQFSGPEKTGAELAQIEKRMQDAARAAERFRDAMFSEQANNRLDAAKKFLDFETPIDKATMALEHFLGLFDAGLLTAEEFNMAVENLGKEFNKLEDIQLPGAAFKGSIEDVSTSIRASVGKQDGIVQDLLRQLVDNTRPLKGIGVEN